MPMSHADGVERVLNDEEKALTCREIADLALSRRYIESRAKDVGNSIFVAVEADIAKRYKNGTGQRFVWLREPGQDWRVGLAVNYPIETSVATHEYRLHRIEAWIQSFADPT